VNVVTILLYGYDKYAAVYGGPRTPERLLHGIAIAGGTPGAYAAQQLFRHKTIKGSFRSRFLVIAIIQLAVIAALWWLTR
jgi:uncharacterized membrane protein YsdA (DUF1294 family)